MKNENDLLQEEADYMDNTDDLLALMENHSEESTSEQEEVDYVIDAQEDKSISTNQESGTLSEEEDEDLLALLDMISNQEEDEKNDRKGDNPTKFDEDKESDLLDNDIYDIDKLLADEDYKPDRSNNVDDLDERNKTKENSRDNMSDFSNLFSDAVSAVGSLEDDDDISNIKSLLPDSDKIDNIDNKEQIKNKKKLPFWKRLFSKKKDKENNEDTSTITKEQKKEAKNQKKEAKNQKKEAKNQKRDKKNKIKDVNADPNNSPTETEQLEKTNAAKEANVKKQEKKKKEDKKKEAKKKKEKKKKVKTKDVSKKVKKTKKEKKPRNEQVSEKDNDFDTKKINKVAIAIVMIFFFTIGVVVVAGTNLYNYTLDVKSATTNFNRQRYTEAYNDIRGLTISKKDKTIYKKIMTVAVVNKELNSYYNYYKIGYYPQALDSLLKGLERYDKYIASAKELGIEDDLISIREQILKELKDKFNISEKEATALNRNSDQTIYSKKVIVAASKSKNLKE